MIVEIFLEFFLDAKSISGKEKTLKKIKKNIIDTYGASAVSQLNEARFSVSVEAKEWMPLVFRIIKYSQTIGRQWVLTGNIEYECSLWTNHSKLVGVDSISVTADYTGKIE